MRIDGKQQHLQRLSLHIQLDITFDFQAVVGQAVQRILLQADELLAAADGVLGGHDQPEVVGATQLDDPASESG